jgi:DNA-binding NarL/FixJ family response regulator
VPEIRLAETREVKRILIADDHELARFGLRSMLAGESDFQVVGEAVNGRQAVDMCRRQGPDLVLMDVRLPEMDGLEATRIVRQQCLGTRVIIITIEENSEWLLEAIRVGAAAYLLKGTTRKELVSTVRRTLAGEQLLHPDSVLSLIRKFAAGTSQSGEGSAKLVSPREREVLRLVAQGHTNSEIAADLMLSISTVKRHIEHVLAKLGVSDRTEAAVRAAELGLLGQTGTQRQLVS